MDETKVRKDDLVKALSQWFEANQVERIEKALKRNGFDILFVPDAKSALEPFWT
jgi:uncharacterized protein (DUF302 family)